MLNVYFSSLSAYILTFLSCFIKNVILFYCDKFKGPCRVF